MASLGYIVQPCLKNKSQTNKAACDTQGLQNSWL
jgi:hypothetical protein